MNEVNNFNQPNDGTSGFNNVNPQMSNPNNNSNNKNMIIIFGVGAVALVAIAVAVYMLFFSSKTLVCTMTEDYSGLNMAYKLNVEFKRDQVDSLDGKITVELGEYADYKDMFVEQLEEEYSEMKEEGIDMKITSDDENVYVDLSADKSNFTEAGFATSDTYEEVKKELEDEGFKCE